MSRPTSLDLELAEPAPDPQTAAQTSATMGKETVDKDVEAPLLEALVAT